MVKKELVLPEGAEGPEERINELESLLYDAREQCRKEKEEKHMVQAVWEPS